MNWRLVLVATWMGTAAACLASVQAGVIPIPNGSFESPTTPFVDLNIDSWQKAPKPGWYVEGGGFLWSQLAGAFKNPAPGSFDHIDNCDGDQACWMFAISEVGLFQDYNSVDWDDAAPTHAFNARFEVGKSYQLSVGVIGMGGGMSNGATVELSLYYRDASSNKVTVAATSITNSPSFFSNRTQLVEFQAQLPTVQPHDPWADQHIGVQLLSTVTTNLQGGYWDFDNLRLVSVESPKLVGVTFTDGRFTLILQSEPGLRFEIFAGTEAGPLLSNWTKVGNVTNLTGTVSFVDATASSSRRFYQARLVP